MDKISGVNMSLLYTETHEWIHLYAEIGTVGISRFFAFSICDIKFVDLPVIGKKVRQGEVVCIVNSITGDNEVHAPISGVVVDVNNDLEMFPEIIEGHPESDGWLFKLKMIPDNIKINEEIKNLFKDYQYVDYMRRQAEERR